MEETVAPPADAVIPSESFSGATVVAKGAGKRFSHYFYPGVAALSVGLALAAFVVNITVLALFGEQDGFVAVVFLGGDWLTLTGGVAGHALFIYAVYVFARTAYKDGFVGPLVLATGFPWVTASYAEPRQAVGAALIVLAVAAAMTQKHLASALLGFVASTFTMFAWGLWVLYVFVVIQKKGKTWAWVGLITLFTPVVSRAETHRLIAEGLFHEVSLVGVFLILTGIVYLCSREGLWLPGFLVVGLVQWRMWTTFTISLAAALVWLPLAVQAQRTLRRLPFIVVSVVWVFFGAWVSAHGLT